MQFNSLIMLTISALASPLTAVNSAAAIGPFGGTAYQNRALSTSPSMSNREIVSGGLGNDYIDARTYQVNPDRTSRFGRGCLGMAPYTAGCNFGFNPLMNGLVDSPLGLNNLGIAGYPYGVNALGLVGITHPFGFNNFGIDGYPWGVNALGVPGVGINDIDIGTGGLDVGVTPLL